MKKTKDDGGICLSFCGCYILFIIVAVCLIINSLNYAKQKDNKTHTLPNIFPCERVVSPNARIQ